MDKSLEKVFNHVDELFRLITDREISISEFRQQLCGIQGVQEVRDWRFSEFTELIYETIDFLDHNENLKSNNRIMKFINSFMYYDDDVLYKGIEKFKERFFSLKNKEFLELKDIVTFGNVFVYLLGNFNLICDYANINKIPYNLTEKYPSLKMFFLVNSPGGNPLPGVTQIKKLDESKYYLNVSEKKVFPNFKNILKDLIASKRNFAFIASGSGINEIHKVLNQIFFLTENKDTIWPEINKAASIIDGIKKEMLIIFFHPTDNTGMIISTKSFREYTCVLLKNAGCNPFAFTVD
jgi:hypothetical protein